MWHSFAPTPVERSPSDGSIGKRRNCLHQTLLPQTPWADTPLHAASPLMEIIMKAFSLGMVALVGIGSPVLGQNPSPAVEAHRSVHVQTITHNDGKPHRQVTHFRHRTIVKTPHGTLVHTETKTTTTTPR